MEIEKGGDLDLGDGKICGNQKRWQPKLWQ
jgi:hypothetical protein